MIEKQIKNLAWNTFKQTGNIDTFMELMKMEDLEKTKNQFKTENTGEYKYGDDKD